jgi:hypothetical protein
VEFDRSRLRHGELIVAISAIVLLASVLLLKWYGRGSTTIDGWHGLAHIRWLLLITILAGLGLVFFQATRRAPAVPAAFSVIVTVLGILTVAALVYRVVINPLVAEDRELGAFVGLASAIMLSYGGYRSIREEGTSVRDGPPEIETVELDRTP